MDEHLKLEELIMEYVKRAQCSYHEAKNKPERYRTKTELLIAEAKLIQIECLAMDLKLIETGTI